MSWLPLLLADPSACLRWLVLRDLFGRPADDPELVELAGLRQHDPLVTELLGAARGRWLLAHGRAGCSRANRQPDV